MISRTIFVPKGTPFAPVSFAILICLLTPCLLVAAASSSDADQEDDAAPQGDTPPTVVQDEIVVSASRVELPAKSVGSSVTVIDREEIESRHQTTVLELLRTVPGIDVVTGGGPGKATSVFVRGGNSSHTLVLVDGVRVNANTDGAFDFADLMTDNVERIEIVRGPQSTLYGSEAVAGVVAISTRRGEGPPRFWAGAEIGDSEHSRLRAGVDGGGKRFDYSFAVASIETDGVSAASENAGNTEDDPWENTTVSGRFGATFKSDGRVDLALRYVDADTGIDGFDFFLGPVDDPNARQEREVLVSALTVQKPFSKRFKQTFFVALHQDEILGRDPDSPFGNFDITSDTSELLLQSEVTLSDNDTLTFGYKVEKREASISDSFDDSLYQRSFFVENLWSVRDRYHFTVSARNDDHSEFGNEATWRFTTSLNFTDRFRFHGSAGTGFKAPTMNELFFPDFGNLKLDPETSEGFDAGLEFTFAEGDVVLDLTYFDQTYDDLILFTFPAGFVNVAEARADGFELSFRFEPSKKLLLQVSHTRTDSKDEATGLQLARRARDKSALYLAFQPLEKLRGTIAVVVESDRLEFDGTMMDDYERLDLTLDYAVHPRLRPYLRIENLFDEDYEELPGFTTPGFRAALGVHFGR